jgi:hypothetical protein
MLLHEKKIYNKEMTQYLQQRQAGRTPYRAIGRAIEGACNPSPFIAFFMPFYSW